MNPPQPIRRYLTDFDSTRTGHVLTDFLVVGSGVAGLSAALEAARYGEVIVATKGDLPDSATNWAQGGVAAVLAGGDTVERHIRDTHTVGGSVNRSAVVELVCRRAPECMRELIEWGVPFDRESGEIHLGLEGGHSAPRVLHAGGDATGGRLVDTLGARLRANSAVRIFEHCFVIDFLTIDGRCMGAVTFHPTYGHQLIWAKQTILASGGIGQLYRETTNPPGITGDGVAAAFRAGARVADMEFVQFHPTALYIAGSSRALVSEAVRGEGAHLVDKSGERFMPAYHPDAELAPRDVVSRAIGEHLATTGATCVYLDVRHMDAKRFGERFPTITRHCLEFGIDPARDLIPVRPAAHFSIGGVVADLKAQTSVTGLLACGEASCSGLHGANRLASNSLLEGLVFGKIAGETAGAMAAANGETVKPVKVRNASMHSPKTMLDLADVRQSLRSLMWRNVGIARHGDRLGETIEIVDFWRKFVLDKTFNDPLGWEVQNMLLLAKLVCRGALERCESRGVHHRSDCGDAPRDDFMLHLAYRLEAGEAVREMLDLNFNRTG